MTKIIKSLVELANSLDNMLLIKHADAIDKIIKKAQHPGAMIAIMAPKSIKDKLKNLKLKNPVDVDDFHVTLIYLGEAKDINEKDRKKIISACEKVCKKYEPFKAKISGFGKFINKKEDVIYASIDAFSLSELRVDLYKEISKILELDNQHGFDPHMSLAYSDEDIPDKNKLPSWKVSKITVAFGGEHTAISLGDK